MCPNRPRETPRSRNSASPRKRDSKKHNVKTRPKRKKPTNTEEAFINSDLLDHYELYNMPAKVDRNHSKGTSNEQQPGDGVPDGSMNSFKSSNNDSIKELHSSKDKDHPNSSEPKLTNSENLLKLEPAALDTEEKKEVKHMEMKINLQPMSADSNDSKDRLDDPSPKNFPPKPSPIPKPATENAPPQSTAPPSNAKKSRARNAQEDELICKQRQHFQKTTNIFHRLFESIKETYVWSPSRKVELVKRSWHRLPQKYQLMIINLMKNYHNVDLEKFSFREE